MHSPEPWNYVPSHGIHSAVSTSGPRRGKTEYVADVASDDVSQAKRDENAQRIVACVNACQGVSTEDLVNALDPNVSINVICQIVGKLRTRGTPDGTTQS